MKHKVDMAIRHLHEEENELAKELLRISELHKAEHGLHHVARDLAVWSQEHVAHLARLGKEYGLDLDAEAKQNSRVGAAVRTKVSELTAHRPEPGPLVLRDLRRIHQMADGVSLDWEVLAQTAQALRDTDLLTTSEECLAQTTRQLQWAKAELKAHAAQIMVS